MDTALTLINQFTLLPQFQINQLYQQQYKSIVQLLSVGLHLMLMVLQSQATQFSYSNSMVYSHSNLHTAMDLCLQLYNNSIVVYHTLYCQLLHTTYNKAVQYMYKLLQPIHMVAHYHHQLVAVSQSIHHLHHQPIFKLFLT